MSKLILWNYFHAFILYSILIGYFSCELEVCVDREKLVTVGVYSVDSHVVGCQWCHWWNLEGKGVAPAASGDILLVWEILVINKDSKKFAFELHVVYENVTEPQASKNEVNRASELWWVGWAVSLWRIKNEPRLIVSLGEFHWVWYCCIKAIW